MCFSKSQECHWQDWYISQSTSPRIATVVLVRAPRGCAGQFGLHYIRIVPAEFYHGLDLVNWDGGTTDCFGLECAENPCKAHAIPTLYPRDTDSINIMWVWHGPMWV